MTKENAQGEIAKDTKEWPMTGKTNISGRDSTNFTNITI